MELPPELPAIRRIVTGQTAAGRSFIAEDGPPPRILSIAERPGYRNANIWRLCADPSVDDPDSILQQSGVLPPAGGIVFRVIDIPPLPADPAEAARQAAALFARMFPDAAHDARSGRSSGMHRTATIDFAVVMSGEIVAILDDGETLMKAGDILIQRGTNHAWENRSSSMVRILFVLCDARAETSA